MIHKIDSFVDLIVIYKWRMINKMNEIKIMEIDRL